MLVKLSEEQKLKCEEKVKELNELKTKYLNLKHHGQRNKSLEITRL